MSDVNITFEYIYELIAGMITSVIFNAHWIRRYEEYAREGSHSKNMSSVQSHEEREVIKAQTCLKRCPACARCTESKTAIYFR